MQRKKIKGVRNSTVSKDGVVLVKLGVRFKIPLLCDVPLPIFDTQLQNNEYTLETKNNLK